MVTSLCTYFAKEVFPKYVNLLEDNSRLSFLHLIDQMISFDMRTLMLISNSGQLLSPREDESLQRVSVLSVFCDWPDWLDIWAAIELGEMLEKLDHEASRNNADDWLGRLQISSDLWCSLYQCLSTVIERSRSLPSILLRASWVEKVSTMVLRGFEAQCRDYFRNKRQWQEKEEGGWAMSKALVGDSRLSPGEDFQAGGEFERDGVRNGVEDCGRRSRRAGFQSCFDGWWEVPQGGVERFGVVLEVLFGVFGKWCLRPEGFFRRLSEGPRQLKMGEREVKEGMEQGKEKWLKEKGIRHLSLGETEKIVKNRVFL